MSRWTLVYDGFDPGTEMLRETLCTLGNGYFATRGALELVDAEEELHYPGTYLAGGYNRLVTDVAGRPVENEDLVNLPNWLRLGVRPGGGQWLDLERSEILSYRQVLDMEQAVLLREIRLRDDDGRETTLGSRRFVHMSELHLAGVELTVTAHNWSGRLDVRSALDGTVENAGVARYRSLASRHLAPVSAGPCEGGIELEVETSQSRLRVVQVARTRLYRDDVELAAESTVHAEDSEVAEELTAEVREGEPVRVEKIVALFTSRDRGISEPALEARTMITRAGTFGELVDSHARAWKQLWRRADVRLDYFIAYAGDMPHEMVQRILRLHILHLLQTVSRNSMDLDVGVPARGWHGEAYRGHIFWDELFIYPFLNFRLPQITRALLRYRNRRIDEARALARAAGYRGAMYPWQSGSNGVEETQVVHLNPRSGRWVPDGSHLQRHVNAAIAYNVWQYHRLTGDREFFGTFGAEMILEIARFWASIAHFNPEIDRFEIHGVMGPDEYHEAYPDADEPGLRNNAYTNVMAAWIADVALQVLDELLPERAEELRESLGLSGDEIATWEAMRHKMLVVFHEDGIISQFEGYEDLEDLDWDGYRERYGDIHRLDRILEAEGDSPNSYKVSKQADVLMLAYLFTDDELRTIFERLGYPFDDRTMSRNYEYYSRRTSHGSTLSQVVHATLAARLDPEHFDRELFTTALESDVADVQGGTTREGIHLGAMAATVDVLTRGFTGLSISDGIVCFDPPIADEAADLGFRIRFRRTWLDVSVLGNQLTVFAHPGDQPVTISVRGNVRHLESGETAEFTI